MHGCLPAQKREWRVSMCALKNICHPKIPHLQKYCFLTTIPRPEALRSVMKILAKQIADEIEHERKEGRSLHCAVYERDLQRIWALNEKDREARIAQFSKEYGFGLRFYKQGLCAIFVPS
jgi:hypothetical protein